MNIADLYLNADALVGVASATILLNRK